MARSASFAGRASGYACRMTDDAAIRFAAIHPPAIRVAGQADAAALAAIATVSFPLACKPQTPTAVVDAFIAENFSVERFGRYLGDETHVILISEVAGEPVGYTMLVFSPPVDPDVSAALRLTPSAELSKCYVVPGQHGRGVATGLMQLSIELARDRGYASLWLGVNDENGRANAFYARYGFEVVGYKTFEIGGILETDFTRELIL